MATTTYTDVDTLMVQLSDELVKIQFQGTPFFNRFAKFDSSNLDTKHTWTFALYSKLQDQLAEALDNSETAVDIDGTTTSNKITYVDNNTVILIDNEWMLVTGGSGTTTLTVTRGYAGSTAATHSDNAPIFVMPWNAIGAAVTGRNDAEFGERQYNFTQTMQREYPVINDIEKMTSFTKTKEATLANQKSIWEAQARVSAERSAFHGYRFNNGTAASTGAEMELTADAGANMTGGIYHYNVLDGGRNTTYSNYSRENLKSGMLYLAKLGAFSGVEKREYKDGEALLFLSPEGFDFYQSIAYPFETYNDGKTEDFGMDVMTIKVSGRRVLLMASDGVFNGEQFLIPNRTDIFKTIIKQWGHEQPPTPNGSRRTEVCNYSWVNEIGSGLLSEYANGLPLV